MPKPKRSRRERETSPAQAGAAAIDVGATMHVAAVGPALDPEPVCSFGTFAADLHRLAGWFKQCAIKTGGVESTSVYWTPAFEGLEQRGFALVLVNARDAKHVLGRKTDVTMRSAARVWAAAGQLSPRAQYRGLQLPAPAGAPA